MKKITKLIQEQEDLLPVYRDKWIKIGLSTESADRTKAENACRRAYEAAGLKPPKQIIWADSPLSGAIVASILKNQKTMDSVRASVWDSVWDSVGDSVRASVRASVWDSVWDSVGTSVRASVWDSVWDSVGDSVGTSVRAWVYGQHDASWLSFYNYFLEVCKLKECEKLRPLMDLSENCGWWIPYENVVILQEKMTQCHLKDGRIHNENGPAIAYKDGFCVYGLNGVRVPKWVVTTDPNDITKEQVLSEKNVEIRRELIRKIGIENFVKKAGSKLLDKKDSYELLSINLGNEIPDARYLKMKNPSIDAWHLEGVHPDCETVEQALSFRNFGDHKKKWIEPKELT